MAGPLTSNQVRGDSYVDNFPRYGFGAGYQFKRWLRADVTLDWRNDIESRGTGVYTYGVANGNGGTSTLRDTLSDSFTSTNITGMANLYVDIPFRNSITPYVGAGIGFVRHQLKGRNYSSTTTCIDTLDCDPTAVVDDNSTAHNKTNLASAGGIQYSLATALMAGFTYNISENGKLDFGYRWMHMQGASFTGRSASIVENLLIPDQNIHELRIGLRYDIN